MFNMLGGIVEDDRKSRNARDTEEWVLESLREQVGGGVQMRKNREMDPSACRGLWNVQIDPRSTHSLSCR